MINNDIKEFVNRQKLGYVATVSEGNIPNISPKGSVIVWDTRTLAFADIRSPNTVKNLSSNPNIEINVVDPILRKGYRFGGKARIMNNGDTFDRILAHYRKDGVKSSINAIVLVDVSSMSEIVSPLYDLGVSEEEMKSRWRDRLNM